MMEPKTRRHLQAAEKALESARYSLKLAFDSEPPGSQFATEFKDDHRPSDVREALDWMGVTIIRLLEDDPGTRRADLAPVEVRYSKPGEEGFRP